MESRLGNKPKTGVAKLPSPLRIFWLIILVTLYQYNQIPIISLDSKDYRKVFIESGGLPFSLTSTETDSSDHNLPTATAAYRPPPKCTNRQFELILQQLPPDQCQKNYQKPWRSDCSFSAASSCPETPWLSNFLATQQESTQFTSLFIGCNKGIDAVAALRMGSRDPTYNVETWKISMLGNHGFTKSSCAQFHKDYTSIDDVKSQSDTQGAAISAQLHCFEPVAATFRELNRTNHDLAWTDTVILHQAAVSSESGELRVPNDLQKGTENQGISDLKCEESQNCDTIPVYTLNEFIPQNIPSSSLIQFLSIDVEGFDFEVLKGSNQILKDRVQYLEFEYNWKGPWAKQHLSDAIDLLDEQHFQCYWPGLHGHIWRITGCWLDHYRFRYWANVVCVNIDLAPTLAEDMERMFLETIELENVVYQRTF